MLITIEEEFRLIRMKQNEERISINNISYNLSDLEKDCWSRLVTGATKSKDSFHTHIFKRDFKIFKKFHFGIYIRHANM